MILLEGDLTMDDMSKVFQGLPGGCPTQPDRMQNAKCKMQNGTGEPKGSCNSPLRKKSADYRIEKVKTL